MDAERADGTAPPAGPLRAVRDDPARMAAMLAGLYADVSDVLAAQAPDGLIPLERIDALVLPWRGVHARTDLQDGRTVIRISLGLINLMYLMIRALASRAVVGGGGPAGPDDVVPRLAEWLDRACAPVAPAMASAPLRPEQVAVAELHTQWAEWFLLAHELAHAHKIDARALATMPVLARFTDPDGRRIGLEHAADLFGVWLLQRMAQARVRAFLARGGDAGRPADGAQLELRSANYAYAGAELTLHAMNMIEDFDPQSRPSLHPTAADRIAFLRDAMARGGQEQLLADALAWSELLAANAPQAIAMASVNRDVAARELSAVLDRAERAADLAWLDDREHILTFLLGSMSGSMGLLLRTLTTEPAPAPRRRAALALAQRYLPAADAGYAPFWAAMKSDDGGWT